MIKNKTIKLVFFLCLFSTITFTVNKKIWAYGETINGFQSHYEIQNQYIHGDCLVIEGFYYIYELQNFTDNTKGSGTHYYYLELNNGTNNYTYYDTDGYYIDLTDIEYKSGYPWVSNNESDTVYPQQSAYNYRYRDIGFQFVIPLSDLKNFYGTASVWNMNITCVAVNTYLGRGTEYKFKQQNVYASKTFQDLFYEDYTIKSNSSLSQTSSDIYADVAYIRSGPGKTSDIVKYFGNKLYWAQGYWFYDLSDNTKSSTGCDTLTWYHLKYGNIFYDGKRFRAAYDANGSPGWIPSVFLGSLTGTPYTITIINTSPEITAGNITVDEGTNITQDILLSSVSVYDYSFGTKKPIIHSTDISLNSPKNKVGTYYVTYYAVDSNNAETFKTITVTICNVLPEINANDKEIKYANMITEQFLLDGITANDAGDGDLTEKIIVYDSGGIILNSNTNNHGIYQITYAVSDSNKAVTYKTINLKIIYSYVRSISLDTLETLDNYSKWRQPVLNTKLSLLLKNNGSDDECEQIWSFTNKDRIQIQKFMTEHKPSKETCKWFLDNFRSCRVR